MLKHLYGVSILTKRGINDNIHNIKLGKYIIKAVYPSGQVSVSQV